MMYRRFLLAGAAVLAATTVPAQAAPASASETEADVALAEADAGEEITVTARRRTERAQAVPLAIATIGGGQIDETGNFNIVKIQQLVPALQVYSSNPRNTAVNIRGLGVPFGLTSDGFEQGVGIYVDDVYNARVAAATFDFLDVAQIEVLRGPQGTLYGKNTTAGAINVTTRQPTFEFESQAEVTFGDLNFRQAKAAISGPLSDTVAFRLAGSFTSRRGTIFNVRSGLWINEQDNLGLRAQLLFRPNANLSITLSADYSSQEPECCGTSSCAPA